MKKIIMVMILSILFLSACNSQDEDASEEAYPNEIMDADEIEEAKEPFKYPISSGTLTYQVKNCRIYDSIADAGIEEKDVIRRKTFMPIQKRNMSFRTDLIISGKTAVCWEDMCS